MGASGVIMDRDPNRSRPRAMGACCSACAKGRPCAGGIKGGMSSLGGLGDATVAIPQTLDQRVADIQASAAQFVAQDAFYKKLQIAAVLLIPAASIITKAILHIRKGTPFVL